jgi:hypothetical protein
MTKQSTGLFDRNGTEIFVGDTVRGNCYGKLWNEVVEVNPNGGFFPFNTPNSEWYITIDLKTCIVIKRGDYND